MNISFSLSKFLFILTIAARLQPVESCFFVLIICYFFVQISSSNRPGAFNGTANVDIDNAFYPIEEIDQILVSFMDMGEIDPSSWIRKYTVVLETKDGRRTYTPANPQQKAHANEKILMKVVPETVV